MDWLVSGGISSERLSLSANKQWIQFDAQAHEVEEIMVADFYIFQHTATGTKNVAVDEYHLPQDIQEHVDFITPGIKMRPDPRELKKLKHKRDAKLPIKRDTQPTYTNLRPIGGNQNPAALIPNFSPSLLTPENCDKYVTAACMRAQYEIPNNTLASPGNELGIFESLNDHYGKYDLDVFFSTLYPYIPNGTYPTEKLVDGAVGSAESAGLGEEDVGVESDLDFMAAYPLIWPQGTVLFQSDDQYYEINQTSLTTPYLGFYNTFFDAIDGSYCTYSAYNVSTTTLYFCPGTHHADCIYRKLATALQLSAWILSTRIPTPVATRAACSAASTSRRTSSPSRTAAAREISPHTT